MFDLSLTDSSLTDSSLTDSSVNTDLGAGFHIASADQDLEMMDVDHISSSKSDIHLDIIDEDTLASADARHAIEPDAFHRDFVEHHDTENPLRQPPTPPEDPQSVDISWGDLVLLAAVFLAVGLLFVHFMD